nr:HD domain-containing protein [uncultured Anaerostipes sp.]
MIGKLICAMIDYNAGDPKRIQHFLKVYAYAKTIGEEEGISSKEQEILETAAVTHDIGIRNSEKKYHSSSGKYQEIEGPPEARKMLEELGYEEDLIERVCYLIGHHHTYNNINGIDYQILVEADFLVNLAEEEAEEETINNVKERIFRTETGKFMIGKIF